MTGPVETLSNSTELISEASARPGVAHVVSADHSLHSRHAVLKLFFESNLGHSPTHPATVSLTCDCTLLAVSCLHLQLDKVFFRYTGMFCFVNNCSKTSEQKQLQSKVGLLKSVSGPLNKCGTP